MQNYWALRKNTLKILRGVNEPKIEKILGDPTAEKIQIKKKSPKILFLLYFQNFNSKMFAKSLATEKKA